MRKQADIDVFGDKDLQRRIVRLSLAPVAVGVVAGFAAGASHDFAEGGFAWFMALVLVSLVALPVHELVHAAAYKLMVPGTRISFGYKDGFLYTDAHGQMMGRRQALAVLLAPAVLLTAALAAGAVAAGYPVLAILLAAVHLSGCAGDVVMAAAIARDRRVTQVRDTEYGLELWEDD